MMGLAHEICSEMGFGWSTRLLLADSALDPSVEYPVPAEVGQYLAEKYGYRPGIRAEATARIVDVLNVLATRLKAERANGNRFLMGAEVTAVDCYWATFCVFLKPLPHEQCDIMEWLRAAFEFPYPDIRPALDPVLIRHRDFMYAECLGLPTVLT